MNLADEFEQLNDEQKDAVRCPDNLVVLAGPGSGKTATLVVKIAQLLSERIDPPSGLACITYNNEAVGEFRRRLARLGVTPRKGVFLGTVHSFCLNCILRPYAPLVSARFKKGIQVANQEQVEQVFAAAVEEHQPGSDPRWLGPVITRYRRARACGENVSGFGDKDPLVAQALEEGLLKAGLIDFEGMVTSALELIKAHAWIREMLAARFPWLLVDEYQDLGGPLHQIVTTLADDAAIKVFAVGDPDQTIYDFTGASPKYLEALAARADFEDIRLKFNYRSGQRLIDASQAALAPAQPRGYVAHKSQKEPGEVYLLKSSGMNADFAAKTVEAARQAIEGGEPLHEIAILYRATGPMVVAIRDELLRQELPFVWERDERFPGGPLVRWLQQAAAWSLASPGDRPSFSQLVREYLAWAGILATDSPALVLEMRSRLYGFLEEPVPADLLLKDWLPLIERATDLGQVLRTREEATQDRADFEHLLEAVTTGDHRETHFTAFAEPGRVKDKIVLTTLHSSKGRQFGAVVIPGCAEGILPPWPWNRRFRRWDPPTPYALSESRRLFYVGVTRAKRAVHLVHAEQFEGRFGLVRLGASRFVEEINARLKEK